DITGFSPVLMLHLRGDIKAEPQTVIDAQYRVTGFNL
ncbi:prepilin peptidase-dependent protein, partial [Salmonella enterica subsp. enterica serovar Infantis]